MTYNLVLYEKTGIRFPLFIDSPGGREVERETIEKTLEIIRREFSGNQLFVCSIFKFDSLNVRDDQILSFDNLKAFDKKTLLD